MKVLKFVGVLVGLSLCYRYLPFGWVLCVGLQGVALWKLVNN